MTKKTKIYLMSVEFTLRDLLMTRRTFQQENRTIYENRGKLHAFETSEVIPPAPLRDSLIFVPSDLPGSEGGGAGVRSARQPCSTSFVRLCCKSRKTRADTDFGCVGGVALSSTEAQLFS